MTLIIVKSDMNIEKTVSTHLSTKVHLYIMHVGVNAYSNLFLAVSKSGLS